MIVSDSVLGWIAIGAAASLAGMIWPFQRGASGIILNFALGVGGSIGAALLSFLILPGAHDAPARLAFAAGGALLSLCAAHALWTRRAHVRRSIAH
jgi:uncharacterized membrane protein YeaQ/YmgE (transglycosylase-associated protein family)